MIKPLTKNQQKNLIDRSFEKASDYYHSVARLIHQINDKSPDSDKLRKQLDLAEMGRVGYQSGYSQALIDIANNPTMLGD